MDLAQDHAQWQSLILAVLCLRVLLLGSSLMNFSNLVFTFVTSFALTIYVCGLALYYLCEFLLPG
jgi:hypothetical protein